MNPQKVVAGTLNVSSGKSSVSIDGRAGQSMDVDAGFDVASLEDWVPKTTGRANGKFHITGAWPKLAIDGGAQGRDIAFGEYSVKSVDVKADMHNPTSPKARPVSTRKPSSRPASSSPRSTSTPRATKRRTRRISRRPASH